MPITVAGPPINVTLSNVDQTVSGLQPGEPYLCTTDTACWLNLDAAAAAGTGTYLPATVGLVLQFGRAGESHALHVIAGGAGKLSLTPVKEMHL